MHAFRLISAIVLFLIIPHNSDAYNYEVRKKNGHVIHIVTLAPSEYRAEIIKAKDSVFGRETVRSMAERSKAEIAINAGFFEIGALDGIPSGTLVIDDKIYALKFDQHSVLKIDKKGLLSVATIKPKIELKIGDRIIKVKKVNRPAKKNEPILYTSAYGSKTSTQNRKEIIFNQALQLLNINEQGNSSIAQDTYVISLPNSEKLDKNLISLHLSQISEGSLIWGIPKLLEDGEIYPGLLEKAGPFYKLQHARTAVGIKPDGTIVLIVAENHYKKTIKTKGTPRGTTVGLTIIELAKLMKSFGCDQAINLDGGGSSTLWIKGKIVNKTIGDADEGRGITIVRPVSNAIVFYYTKSTK